MMTRIGIDTEKKKKKKTTQLLLLNFRWNSDMVMSNAMWAVKQSQQIGQSDQSEQSRPVTTDWAIW